MCLNGKEWTRFCPIITSRFVSISGKIYGTDIICHPRKITHTALPFYSLQRMLSIHTGMAINTRTSESNSSSDIPHVISKTFPRAA